MQRIVVETSNALSTLILSEKQCFRWLPESVLSLISELEWKRISDGWSGDQRTPDSQVQFTDSAVRPAGDGVLSAANIDACTDSMKTEFHHWLITTESIKVNNISNGTLNFLRGMNLYTTFCTNIHKLHSNIFNKKNLLQYSRCCKWVLGTNASAYNSLKSPIRQCSLHGSHVDNCITWNWSVASQTTQMSVS